MAFHSHCYVTDLVRRRRWKRRRRVAVNGPWLQLARIPLVHVDVAVSFYFIFFYYFFFLNWRAVSWRANYTFLSYILTE